MAVIRHPAASPRPPPPVAARRGLCLVYATHLCPIRTDPCVYSGGLEPGLAGSSAWPSALLIAVAISSVNSAIRDPVAAGAGAGFCHAATLIPHTWPSTWIGVATVAR